MKVCTKCQETKPLDEFHRDRTKRDGLMSACRVCKTAYETARRKANPDTVKEDRKRYRTANREKYLAGKAAYRAANKGRIAIYNAIRQAGITAERAGVVMATYSVEDIIDMWGPREEWKCVYCSSEAESIDHVQPMSKGGADAIHNIVPSCMSCNNSKGSHNLGDWFTGRPAPKDSGQGRYAQAAYELLTAFAGVRAPE